MVAITSPALRCLVFLRDVRGTLKSALTSRRAWGEACKNCNIGRVTVEDINTSDISILSFPTIPWMVARLLFFVARFGSFGAANTRGAVCPSTGGSLTDVIGGVGGGIGAVKIG